MVNSVDELFKKKTNFNNKNLKIKILGNKILNLALKEVNFFVNK